MAFPMYPHEAERFQNESTYPAVLALEDNKTVSLKNITSIIKTVIYIVSLEFL